MCRPPPPPSNFKMMQPDFDHIRKVLRDGIPGTAMPVWKDQLSDTQRWQVIRFLEAFVAGRTS